MGALRSVAGQPHSQTLREMYHTAWTAREGVPNDILAFAQTADGFIWMATDHGLYRFDGVHFSNYQPVSGPAFLGTNITGIEAMPDGGLWIGYEFGGASFLKDGHNTNYPEPRASAGTVFAFAQDRGGVVWMATAHGLKRRAGAQWETVGANWGFEPDFCVGLLLDRDGTLWVGAADGLRYLPKGSTHFRRVRGVSAWSQPLAQDRQGTIWALGADKTLRAIDPVTDALDRGKAIHIDAGSLAFGADGSAWIPTNDKGVVRAADINQLRRAGGNGSAARQRFTESDGLTSNFTIGAHEDHEGGFWIATIKGVDYFRPAALTPVQLPAGSAWIALTPGNDSDLLIATGRSVLGSRGDLLRLAHGIASVVPAPVFAVGCAYRDPHGTIWLGGQDHLWRSSDGRFVPVPLPPFDSPAPHYAQAMRADSSGALWVDFARSPGVYRYQDGQWTHRATRSFKGVLTMFATADGRLWFGEESNIIEVLSGDSTTTLGVEQHLAVGNVFAIYQFRDQIWVGGESGLALYAGGRFHQVRVRDDVPLAGVTGIVGSANGDVWVNQSFGVTQIGRDEIQRFSADTSYRPRVRLLTYLDGVVGAPAQIRPLPTAVAGHDGRLYFATRDALQWLDPDHLSRNTRRPPVYIEAITADGATVRDPSSQALPANTGHLEIDYTALSFLIPDRVRFRYKLEGFDRDWQDAGTRRQAFYSALPPGHYTFRVVASNNDGVWNESGASLALSIPPTFVQSIWFKLLCAAAVASLLWAFYLMRLRQVTAQVRGRLYERMVERERIARDLHDTFFQGIQGLLLRFNTGTALLKDDEPARAIFRDALEQSDDVMLEGRELVLELRTGMKNPRDLSEAFAIAANEFQSIRPVDFKLISTGDPRPLQPLVWEETYRIGREALGNAFRHSGATAIEVELTYDARDFRVCVRDNGTGIDQKILKDGYRADHWGLPGMRERAKKIGAHVDIWSRERAGTEVDLRIPAAVAYQRGVRGGRFPWSRRSVADREGRLE
jgi:signal transduction histidine kinase/ligand-binding sensor domain-containing protein